MFSFRGKPVLGKIWQTVWFMTRGAGKMPFIPMIFSALPETNLESEFYG